MSSALHLTKAMRRQVDAIAAELKPWGLRWELANDGPHMMIKVHGPRGGVWRLGFASTPRDQDAAEQFARQKARRLIREINRRLGL